MRGKVESNSLRVQGWNTVWLGTCLKSERKCLGTRLLVLRLARRYLGGLRVGVRLNRCLSLFEKAKLKSLGVCNGRLAPCLREHRGLHPPWEARSFKSLQVSPEGIKVSKNVGWIIEWGGSRTASHPAPYFSHRHGSHTHINSGNVFKTFNSWRPQRTQGLKTNRLIIIGLGRVFLITTSPTI